MVFAIDIHYNRRAMPAQHKRRLWQLHLSTAVMLMFVAGGLLWMNMRHYDVPFQNNGWPCAMYFKYIALDSEEATIQVGAQMLGKWPTWYGPWHIRGAVINISVALAALVFVAMSFEYLIRRREVRKP